MKCLKKSRYCTAGAGAKRRTNFFIMTMFLVVSVGRNCLRGCTITLFTIAARETGDIQQEAI